MIEGDVMKCSFGSCKCSSGYMNASGHCEEKSGCSFDSDCKESPVYPHCHFGSCNCDDEYYVNPAGHCIKGEVCTSNSDCKTIDKSNDVNMVHVNARAAII